VNADLLVKFLYVVRLYLEHVDRNLFTLSLCVMNDKLVFHTDISQIYIDISIREYLFIITREILASRGPFMAYIQTHGLYLKVWVTTSLI
jgi:hypothetical protein